ncbi:YceI family protein [bacterium]|nr:YceI family protein [bacterium]
MTRTVLFNILFTAGLLLFAVAGLPEPLVFSTIEGDSRNMAMFESNAPLERIIGRTHDLQATLAIDPSDLSSKISGTFTVDLSTLDTGLQLRNQHMRENHLETDKYPEAVFKITEVQTIGITSLTPEKPVLIAVTGELTLHGVTKTYTVPGEITYWTVGEEKMLSGRAKWKINLQDHEVNRPRYLFMKLAETQVASISFVMKTP